MKLKIDENLPAACTGVLRNHGFEADTVFDEGLAGAEDSLIASRSLAASRVLLTLDLDFANIKAYPPAQHAGIIVLRPKRQSQPMILALMPRIVLALANRSPIGELWVVEPDRIRFRKG